MVVERDVKCPARICHKPRGLNVAFAGSWVTRWVIVRHDNPGRTSANSAKQDSPAVDIHGTHSTDGNNLMINQPATGIEEQYNEELVATKSDQML